MANPEIRPDEPEMPVTAPEPAPPPEADAVEVIKPDVAPPPQPAPAPVARRSSRGFFGTLIGGALAAGLGFGAAQYVPDGWPLGQTRDLAARVAQQDDVIAGLKTGLDRLEADLATRPDEARLRAIETAVAEATAAVAAIPATGNDALAGLAPRLDALEARLATLEATPLTDGGVSAGALAQFQGDLAAIRAEVAAQKATGASAVTEIEKAAEQARARLAEAEAQATALKAEAEATARMAANRAALARVQAALDSGEPFAAALGDLQAGGVEVPAVLAGGAEGGLPTLRDLQTAFPEAARLALEASLRSDMGDTFADRVASFVRSQTGARSLTPREGDDPDAVLSRAEAALAAGDLPATLTELGALRPEGQAEMADWVALANRREAAIEAVQSVAATLGVK